MASVGTIWSSLKLNISNFSSSLNTAASQLKAFSKTVNGQTNNAANAMKNLKKNTEAYGLTLKSVSRIISGIVISQVFYRGLQAIKSAERAVWDFSSSLEYAKIAYTNLFNDNELAEEFINVLKDFAAVSPFDFKESEQAAKRLLAYGVQTKNVMYVMQGVMSAAAMQGDSTKVESISRALGQIYTKGRLMNEEMRQLAEAGIPAYEILKEKLGLTQKQLQNLGNESIPASKAINALVDGMTERFGNVTTAATKTMTGLISNLRDNATMLASGLFEPMYLKIKSVVGAVGDLMYSLREMYELKGAGGVLEALVPEELQSTIRMFIANLISLGHTIGNIVQALNSLLRPAILGLIMAFNAVSPVINSVVSVLSGMIYIVASNEVVMKGLAMAVAAAAAMWVAYKAKLILAAVASKVIAAMSLAVKGLSIALSVVVAHPFWTLLLLLIGTVTALTGTFGKLGEAIRGVFSDLTSIGGVDPDKLLLPSQKERANDLDKFNKKLDDTADSMDELADSTGKATKAAKGLLAFDEVFKLNEPDEGTNNGITTDTDIDLSGLDFGGVDAYMPEVPTFDGWVNNWLNNLKQAFAKVKEGISSILETSGFADLLGAALGGLIGSAIGKLAGNSLLGAGIGALVGWLIGAIASAIATDDWSKVGIPLGANIGALLGGLIGGVPGAIIGAGIGTLVGWIGTTIFTKLQDAFGVTRMQGIATYISGALAGIFTGLASAFWVTIITPIGTSLGSAASGVIVGSLKRGIKGGIIGAISGLAAGLLTNALTGWMAKELDLSESDLNNSAIGQSIGGLIGGIAGLILTGGNPIGAALGTMIGTVVGGVAGLLASSIGELIGNIIGGVAELLSQAGTAVSEFFTGISATLNALWSVITAVWNSIWAVVGTVLSDIWNAVSTVFNDISIVCEAIFGVVEEIWYLIRDLIVVVVSDIWANVSAVFSAIYTFISTKINAVLTIVKTIFSAIYTFISTKINAVLTIVKTIFSAIYTFISTKINAVLTIVKTIFSAIYTFISDKVNLVKTSISVAFSAAYNTLNSSISNMYNTVKTGISAIYNTFTGWISNMWDNVFGKLFGWIGDGIEQLREFFGLESRADESKLTQYSSSTTTTSSSSKKRATTSSSSKKRAKTGHATGGIFNREHVANFAEGNKAEAIIPLENNSAMQPFVDAVSNGLTASLAPIVASIGGQQQLQPLYVGTLIADDRSLKELERKMNVIRLKEDRRR